MQNKFAFIKDSCRVSSLFCFTKPGPFLLDNFVIGKKFCLNATTIFFFPFFYIRIKTLEKSGLNATAIFLLSFKHFYFRLPYIRLLLDALNIWKNFLNFSFVIFKNLEKSCLNATTIFL